jgi:hypothetical protein
MAKYGSSNRALGRQQPQYFLEEPATGLYLTVVDGKPHLARAKDASRFATREAALVASSQLQGSPHELVRLDP